VNPDALKSFQSRSLALVERHPVVVNNAYTAAFARGGFSLDDIRHFTVQFSVFSHLFIEAQLLKCINSRNLKSYRASKEILMNELGVIFTERGSVDGGRFRFAAGHFEWLTEFASHLGLSFDRIGKRRFATRATVFFCDELTRLYGSDDFSVAHGASFAIEHWAAAGFWKELITGLSDFKRREVPELPLGFWTWHDQLEQRHAEHTDDELLTAYRTPGFRDEAFLQGAVELLDAVQRFWEGLLADRNPASTRWAPGLGESA